MPRKSASPFYFDKAAADRVCQFFETVFVHVKGKRAGLDQRHTFHTLRHSAVNGHYRATKDILLTQRFARHSSLLVTSVYLHPTDEDLARSVQNIR